METEPSSKEQYDRAKAAEEAERAKATVGKARNRILKYTASLFVAGAAVGGFAFYIARAPTISENDIVSRSGIHWHPELKIVIRGVAQTIPADIGIGAVHNPIHTHDATGIVHLEFSGLVRKSDAQLQKFLDVWNKPFADTCVLDVCAEENERVKFFVNGVENSERGNYAMKDGDKLEIRLE